MFWVNKLTEEIKEKFKDKIAHGEKLVIRDEKTASGRVHIGAMRGLVIHGIISQALSEKGVKNEYLYEINDFDPMDSIPAGLPKDYYAKYMGCPLRNIPSPDKKAKNFAEYYAKEFINVFNKAGFYPTLYRSYDLYKSGRYDDVIRKVLENAGRIRSIYKEVSGGEKNEEWHPLHVICEKCGKVGTTRVISFDGKKVRYICEPSMVEWARGCSYAGEISPFGGNAKLPWKVKWPCVWKVLNVDIEGAGKDHSAAGGSRDIGKRIAEEILGYKNPFDIPYEFFVVGGKKMSASKGLGTSAKEISDLIPSEIMRLLMIRKEPNRVIDFIPDGDTIPNLFDEYDKMHGEYFENPEGDFGKIYYFSQVNSDKKPVDTYNPRFLRIVFMMQMPHMKVEDEVKKLKGEKLTKEDKKSLKKREKYADKWIKSYAPEKYKFKVQEKIPAEAMELTDSQKKVLDIISSIMEKENIGEEELHGRIHSLKDKLFMHPKEIFQAVYIALLGKKSGPQAGWFLKALNKDFVIKRFREAAFLKAKVENNQVVKKHNIFGTYDKIVIGKIKTVRKHPNADKLFIADVYIANGKAVQVVCGGTNLYSGQKVVVSLPGARVKWHGEKKLTKVKKAKIRGEESFGMICAANELGLQNFFSDIDLENEIMDLKRWKDLYIGQPLIEAIDKNIPEYLRES